MNRPLILHVEDDPNDVFLFSRAFKKAELAADLRPFGDGDDLITFLSAAAAAPDWKTPSLMLLDIKLPRKSGFEVLEWIRSQPSFRYLPVIMLTSSAQADDVRRSYGLGANGYLVKPMDMQDAVTLFQAINLFWLQLNIGASPVTNASPAPSASPAAA